MAIPDPMRHPPMHQRLLFETRPALQGFLFGLLVVIVLVTTDQLSMRLGLKESQRVLDDVIGGLIAGLIVFAYARVRLRHIRQRLEVIQLMNHHIRNALQVIRYAAYIPSERDQVAHVDEAIERIDWALREILPGNLAADRNDRRRAA